MDGCSQLTDTFTNAGITINQMDFSNMPRLQILSIQNCTGLVNDIDLTDNEDIRKVNTAGTSLNVILPSTPKVTNLTLGAPSEIVIDSPTVLSPDNLTVKSYEYLDSLELVNIPNNKGFRMFGKIMKSMGAEMMPNTWVQNGELTYNTAWMTSTEIYINKGDSVTSNVAGYLHEYYTDGSYRGLACAANQAYTMGTWKNVDLDYIRYTISSNTPAATLTDDTTSKILVKYEA